MKKNKKGFTLIELLVVIAIIGVVLSVIVLAISTARSKARDTKRKQDITQINNAIALYQADHGGLPPDLGNSNCASTTTYDPSCYASTGQGLANWEILATQLAPYIKTLPTDPCPSCTASISPLTVFAANPPFEYVYQAPAAVNAYLVDKGINPVQAGIRDNSFSIYASALEVGKTQAFGFGLSVPLYTESSNDEGGGGTNDCPYIKEENAEYLCAKWVECQKGSEEACKEIGEGNTTQCPYTSEKDGEKLCEAWSGCLLGVWESCQYIGGSKVSCPFTLETKNGEELCQLWAACYEKEDTNSCENLAKILSS